MYRSILIGCDFRRLVGRGALLAGAVSLMSSGQALAQAGEIDEVLVTVRKKEESLQDVPISVNAFTEQDIERRGIRSLADITRETPGLILDEGFSPQDTRLVIRGLSPTRGRPNAAFLQDGIDISSEAITTAGGSLLINPRLFDVERIEVVKGPQSALYGRSAFAGAINYVTKRPGDELEGRLTVDLNDQNAYEGTIALNGPVIADTLSLGLNAGVWDEAGYFVNSLTGEDVGGTDGFGVAGTALLQLGERVEFFARVEYTDDNFDPQAQATVQTTDTLPLPAEALGTVVSPAVTDGLVPRGTVPKSDTLVIRNSENPRTGVDYPGTEREVTRFSLIGTFDLDWGDVTWFSHIASADTVQFQDAQKSGSLFQAQNGAETNLDQETDLISQELRFSRSTDGPIDWTVGALYWKEEVDLADGSLSCFVNATSDCATFIAPLGTTEPLNKGQWSRDTEHWSVYAAIDWQLAERWTLGLEARYSDEELDIVGPDAALLVDPFGLLGGGSVIVPPLANPVAASTDDDYFAPKVTLEWMPNDDLMFYVSVAEGVKPAGISTVTGGAGGFDPDLLAFDQEQVWVYELGGKTTLADGRVRLNGAFFFQDFSEKQVDTQVPLDNGLVGIAPVNAASAEIWGLETDLTWLATDELTLTLSYTWLDAEYGDFKRNSGGVSDLARAGNCRLTQVSGDDLCELDLSGRTLEDVPEHSFLGIVGYQYPVSPDFDLLAELQVQYQSERYDTAFNVLEYDEFWMTDIRLGLTGANWDFLLYVDNVFDDDTTRSGFVAPDFESLELVFVPPPTTFVLPNKGFYNLTIPRTFGVRLSYKF